MAILQIPNNDSEFLNVSQAAAFLGISVDTIYSWSMQKRLPYYKAGRLNRYKKSDLLNFMESLRVEPHA